MYCGSRTVKPGFYFKSAAKLISASVFGFCTIEILTGNEKFYKHALLPLVHRITTPETAHRLAVFAAKYHSILAPFADYTSNGTGYKKELLTAKCFGYQFENPIGLAAGFDKDAEAIQGLSCMGLGFIEVGSITPEPQPGNDKPRVFRLAEDKAVINRYGFNSSGHQIVEDHLKTTLASLHGSTDEPRKCFLGVNLGRNKTSLDSEEDFVKGLVRFAPYSDYVVVNVSSPNTPGLRDMQVGENLKRLLTRLQKARRDLPENLARKPLLVKVAPDLNYEDKKTLAKLCLDKALGVDGLIVGNTTISRPADLISPQKQELGGLSGKPLRTLSTQCVKDFRILTSGRLPIIGCGGISSGLDAYEKIRAGASLVQFYTALIYEGFPVIGKICRELAQCLEQDGYTNVEQAIGADCPL